ncbi:hypothetical protein SARC_07162, partial [Sphaeroforma arctica JP610]
MNSELTAINERLALLLSVTDPNGCATGTHEQRGQQAFDLVVDINQLCIKVQDPNTIKLCFAILLNHDGGLLLAIAQMEELQQGIGKPYLSAYKALLGNLQVYVKRLNTHGLLLEKQARDLKDLSLYVLTRNKSSPIRNDSLILLRTLIKLRINATAMGVRKVAMQLMPMVYAGTDLKSTT